MGSARNQDGLGPCSKDEIQLAAKEGSWTSELMRPLGAAVSSADSTGAVGRSEFRDAARGAMERRSAGLSVGTGMPAWEARARSCEKSVFCRLMMSSLFLFSGEDCSSG